MPKRKEPHIVMFEGEPVVVIRNSEFLVNGEEVEIIRFGSARKCLKLPLADLCEFVDTLRSQRCAPAPSN